MKRVVIIVAGVGCVFALASIILMCIFYNNIFMQRIALGIAYVAVLIELIGYVLAKIRETKLHKENRK